MNAIQSQLGLEFKPETQCCNKCGVTKPIEEFAWNRVGSQRFRRKICIQCRSLSEKTKREAVKKKGLYTKPLVGTPCPICKLPMTHDTSMTGVCFDHSTITSEFRGWICKRCNVGLGNFGDSVEIVQSALDYLKKHEKP